MGIQPERARIDPPRQLLIEPITGPIEPQACCVGTQEPLAGVEYCPCQRSELYGQSCDVCCGTAELNPEPAHRCKRC